MVVVVVNWLWLGKREFLEGEVESLFRLDFFEFSRM